MPKQDEYVPSGSDQSEVDLLLLWTDRFCDPLAIGIREWSAMVTDAEQGSAISSDLYEGWNGTGYRTTTIPADAFTGSFREVIDAGLQDGSEASLIWFQPTEMAPGSVLLSDGNVELGLPADCPGTGFKVSALVKTTEVNAVTGLTMTEERGTTIGWVIPDRVPHALSAEEFLSAMGQHWGALRKFRSSQVERTPTVVDEEKRAEFRARLT